MLFTLISDFFLKLSLVFANICIVQQFCLSLNFDSEQARLASLAFHILHDLIVIGTLLFVLSKDPVYSIYGWVSYELLKFLIIDETSDVIMEDYIKCGTKHLVFILIMPSFANSVRQLPLVPRLPVGCLDKFPPRLVHVFMDANVDKGLLVEVLFVDLT